MQTLECSLELNPHGATTKLKIMEFGIQQWQRKIVKSITVLRFCKSEHPAAQHDFSQHHQSSHNLPLYSASYWNVAVTNPARRGKNDHHWQTAPTTDTNQCHRHVAHNMAKGIQISRVMSAKYDPLDQDFGSQSQTALQRHHRPPFLWYLRVGSVKAEPQWEKYPNFSVRSFVTSKKLILGFYFVAKTIHIYVAFSLSLITFWARAYPRDALATCCHHTCQVG